MSKTQPFLDLMILFFDSPIDYIKIPHHGSSTGDQLPIKLNEFGLKAPSVATSTIFIKHHLPQVDTLQKYKKWGTNEIYVTNSFENFENTCTTKQRVSY